jgi:hypothetical protein
MVAGQKKLGSAVAEQEQSPMPVVIDDTPPGYNWGWYSREDPRMHLQVMEPKAKKDRYKVWLETRGRRTFEPATPIKSDVLKAIRAAVTEHRQFIEDKWVRFMISNGWLEAHLSIPEVILNVYPGTPNRFMRRVNLGPHLLQEEIKQLTPGDIALSVKVASLQIWPTLPESDRQDIRLSTILWEG